MGSWMELLRNTHSPYIHFVQRHKKSSGSAVAFQKRLLGCFLVFLMCASGSVKAGNAVIFTLCDFVM